ncbi:hypothetical protein [Ligilactobacillus apodemi]|uniref:Immunity protein n=1 Tax=Ligilactobacillus apodemi DSM 16634 = JCM 16172 TaxID=1423724 RepID=A0A0R1UCJ4_9LACO|nr:hypothetical protein [Ligilactobacillus apodemi]KRL87419.1 hypothetical protein FC32_GL001646 [Ligilactobacillus apodemi DSM 16634 = JCM 16172]MCR1901652.1 hypothetical protein [Ligilactobacillus apodemi]
MVKGLIFSVIIILLGAFELFSTYRYYSKLPKEKRPNTLSSGRLWLGIVSGVLLVFIGISALLGVLNG